MHSSVKVLQAKCNVNIIFFQTFMNMNVNHTMYLQFYSAMKHIKYVQMLQMGWFANL